MTDTDICRQRMQMYTASKYKGIFYLGVSCPYIRYVLFTKFSQLCQRAMEFQRLPISLFTYKNMSTGVLVWISAVDDTVTTNTV